MKKMLMMFGIAMAAIVARSEYTDDCITFSSAASFTLETANGAKNWDGTLWTSTDKTNWTEWNGTEVAAAQTGVKYNLYVRGNAKNTKITGDGGWQQLYRWCLVGSNVECTGNIETLRGATGDNPSPTRMAKFCYDSMFAGCKSLTAALALPATKLADNCYSYMFGYTALKEAPALPATTLTVGCYVNMFSDCRALTNAPVLPATTLADYCYNGMFSGCTSLTNAPALPVTKLAKECYAWMFNGCTSLTSAPALPATTLTVGCYNRMFEGCTSLTNAPALPATMLAKICYSAMFSGCTSLTNAPSLPATMLARSCYQAMFSDCRALTNAPALPASTLADYCYCSMFCDCRALKNAPELPATTLADYCYYCMFAGCTVLEVNKEWPGKEWKIPATSTTASYWGDSMFYGTKGTLQGQPALNTTYYIASAPLEPIDPGGEIVVPEGKAEEKAAEINGDPAVKAQYLKAPGGIETTAQYRECFDAVATSGSTVAFVLNEEGTNQVVEAMTAAKTSTLESVLSKTGTLVIGDPLIGFYYSLKQGSDVTVGDKADLNKLAGRDDLSFPLTTDKSKYFYQSLVTPTPVLTK